MITAMEKSRKIILVLSNSYLRSQQCKGQADLAGELLASPRFPQHYFVIIILAFNKQTGFNNLLTSCMFNSILTGCTFNNILTDCMFNNILLALCSTIY